MVNISITVDTIEFTIMWNLKKIKVFSQGKTSNYANAALNVYC